MIKDLDADSPAAVGLHAVKTFLRVDESESDGYILRLISEATRKIEDRCGVSLVKRRQRFSGIPSGAGVYLNRYPVQSVHSIKQGDREISANVNIRSRPLLIRTEGQSEVTIDFTAGYGPTSQDVPTPLRQGLLLLIARLYEAEECGGMVGFPMMVDVLIQPYRGVRL